MIVNSPNQELEKPNLPDEILSLVQGTNRKYIKYNHKVKRTGLASASLINSPRLVLDRSQLLQCADCYVNDGVVRTAINKLIFTIKGDHIKQSVGINEEVAEIIEEADLKAREQTIFAQNNVKGLRQKTVRLNKRCHLDERTTSLLTSIFTFGRGALHVIRHPKVSESIMLPNGNMSATWERYGEPRALLLLNSLRIVDVQREPVTGEFEGFLYNYGEPGRERELIVADDLLVGFNDDANLYDNTAFSGLPLLWPIISVSQSNGIINDEDIPESTRALWAKWGHFFAGTGEKAVLRQFRKAFEAGTLLVHGKEKAKAEIFDLARSLLELTQTREANAKYLLWSIGLPLFIMFEDTANFATANEALQAFKAISIKRYRTWLGNILEPWYDHILADHLNVDVSEVIAEEIKMKAIFEDILFETKDKTASYLKPLADGGYIDKIKLLKELGYDDVIERLAEIEKKAEVERKQNIQDTIDKMIAAGKVPPLMMQQMANGNGNGNGSKKSVNQ